MVLHLRVCCFVLLDVHQLKLSRSQAKLFTLKQVDAAMIYAKGEIIYDLVRLFCRKFFCGKWKNYHVKFWDIMKTENHGLVIYSRLMLTWNIDFQKTLNNLQHFLKTYRSLKQIDIHHVKNKRFQSSWKQLESPHMSFLRRISWHIQSFISKNSFFSQKERHQEKFQKNILSHISKIHQRQRQQNVSVYHRVHVAN